MEPDPYGPGPSGYQKSTAKGDERSSPEPKPSTSKLSSDDSNAIKPDLSSSKFSSDDRNASHNIDRGKSTSDSIPSTSKGNPGCRYRKASSSQAGPSSSKDRAEVPQNASASNQNENTKGQNQSNFFQGAFPNESIPNFFPSFGEFNSGFSNFPFSAEPPKKTYKNSEEYFADLRLWIQQAFFWQSVSAAFPYFMMCQQLGQATPQISASVPMASSSLNTNSVQPFSFPQFPMPGFQSPRQDQPTVARQEVIDGVECRIPSFWKRIAAEFIDFVLLFFVKIAVTYVAVDFFHFVEMDTLDIFQKDVNLAYKSFIQITQDIVILEIIHRLVVCAFETFWLIGGQNGRVGGSTPGKSMMGLRVISCDSSSALAERDDRVVVKPGGNLGLGTAFLRALTKNFVLALLIPTSFAFIFFPHNRTGYDMICNTIVVEEPIVPHRVHLD